MWQFNFETSTDLTPEQLWPVIADVANWDKLDSNIDFIEIKEKPKSGAKFVLKPKGGPILKFLIGDFEPLFRYSDICRMPLGRMETRHRFTPGAQTLITVSIEINGFLAPFWGLVVGRKHASGLAIQTERIIAQARLLLTENKASK